MRGAGGYVQMRNLLEHPADTNVVTDSAKRLSKPPVHVSLSKLSFSKPEPLSQ